MQKLHPIERPNGSLDIPLLTKLDRQAKSEGYKIIFEIPGIAQDFHKFYDHHVRKPLKELLDKGVTGKELASYFTLEELEGLPDIRVVGEEAVEAAGTLVAESILNKLTAVTQQEIEQDITTFLNQQYHRAKDSARDYTARSEFSELVSYYHKERRTHSIRLMPVRGENALEDYYEDTILPRYHIYEVSPK